LGWGNVRSDSAVFWQGGGYLYPREFFSTLSFAPPLEYRLNYLGPVFPSTDGMKCFTVGLFSVLGLVARGVSAACAGNLLVDDFANFGSSFNTLGQYSSG